MDAFIRYVKFCLVGASGVVIDMGSLYLLLSLHPSALRLNASKLIAAEAAIVNNFAWNEIWAFGRSDSQWKPAGARLWRFLKFNLISSSGIALTTGLLNLQVLWLHVNVYLANLIAIVLVSVWNYGWSARFAWKVNQPKERPRGDVKRLSG